MFKLCQNPCSTEQRERFVSPNLAKYAISGIAPVTISTGVSKFQGSLPPPSALSHTLKTPHWENLLPLSINIHSPIQIAGRRHIIDELDQSAAIVKRQPNKFLLDLESQYPEVYDKIKASSGGGFLRHRRRLGTTIQFDYGRLRSSEHYEGLYRSPEAMTTPAPRPAYGHW